MTVAAGLVVLGVHIGRRNSRSHPACLGLDPGGWWLSVGPKLSDHDILSGTHPHHKLTTAGPPPPPQKLGAAFKKREQVKTLIPPPPSCREGTGPLAMFH